MYVYEISLYKEFYALTIVQYIQYFKSNNWQEIVLIGLISNDFSYFGKNNLSQNISHFTIQTFLVHQWSLIVTHDDVSVLHCSIISIEMIITNILLTNDYTIYIISTRHNYLLQALEQCFRKAKKCLSVPFIIILLKRRRQDFKGS